MKSLALAAAVTVALGGAVAAQTQTVYKAGDPGVRHPQVVVEKKPAYTAAAMRQRIQGSVVLEAVIDTDGKPTNITVARSLDPTYGLDANAISAFEAWRFKPATKDGKPVPMLVSIEMMFTLRDRQVYDKTYIHVKPPVLVKPQHPSYTAEAMRNRVEGVIEVEGIVGVDGKVTDVRVVRGLEPGLDANAIETMKRCTFTPGILEGRAVPYRVSMEFTFTLRN